MYAIGIIALLLIAAETLVALFLFKKQDREYKWKLLSKDAQIERLKQKAGQSPKLKIIKKNPK